MGWPMRAAQGHADGEYAHCVPPVSPRAGRFSRDTAGRRARPSPSGTEIRPAGRATAALAAPAPLTLLGAAPRRRCRRNGPNRAGAGAGDCGAGAAPAAGRFPACGRAGGGCVRPAALARAAPSTRGRRAGSPYACGRSSCPARARGGAASRTRSVAGARPEMPVRSRGFPAARRGARNRPASTAAARDANRTARRRSRTQASRVSGAVAPCLGPLAATAWHSHSIAPPRRSERLGAESAADMDKSRTQWTRDVKPSFSRRQRAGPRGPARRGAREAGGKIAPCRRCLRSVKRCSTRWDRFPPGSRSGVAGFLDGAVRRTNNTPRG